MPIIACSPPVEEPVSVKVPVRKEVAGIQFVLIPAGEFLMGEPDRIIGKVKMSAFWISEAEITNAQFERFRKRERTSVNPEDEMPVTRVTREEIYDYLKWLKDAEGISAELPTTAQWEYAARGGLEQKNFPWGNRFDERLALIGFNRKTLEALAAPVKSYPPNGYGVYDMCGNVGEYVREYDGIWEVKDFVDPVGRTTPESSEDHWVEVRGIGVGEVWPWIWMRNGGSSLYPTDETGFRIVLVESGKPTAKKS